MISRLETLAYQISAYKIRDMQSEDSVQDAIRLVSDWYVGLK